VSKDRYYKQSDESWQQAGLVAMQEFEQLVGYILEEIPKPTTLDEQDLNELLALVADAWAEETLTEKRSINDPTNRMVYLKQLETKLITMKMTVLG